MTCPKCGDSRLRPDGQDEGWFYCLGCWATVNLTCQPLDIPLSKRPNAADKPREGKGMYAKQGSLL